MVASGITTMKRNAINFTLPDARVGLA